MLRLLSKSVRAASSSSCSLLAPSQVSLRASTRLFSSKKQARTAPMDGAEACANAAYALSETAFIYPITPSTTMSELFDAWNVADRKSVIGEMPVKVYEMQSEGGAAGAMHGAAVSGSLATTFTASQGLLLMIPNLYQFSGELLPGVFHVAARAITKQALSIFGDHQDVMACRQTGIALLCSNNPQEAQDLATIAHMATIKTRVPFIHFQDGWRTSAVVRKIELIEDSDLLKMYPFDALEQNLRNTGMNIDNANMRGTAQGPDVYFQSLVANHKYYLAAPEIIDDVMKEFGAVTGREYGLFNYYGSPSAERCIIMMGSGCDTAEQTIDAMNKLDANVGLLKVRLFRPWSTKHFISQLPESVKKIAVLDRTREDGALAQPLHLDITMALNESKRLSDIEVLTGGQYGLSSKEFTPAMVRAVYANLDRGIDAKNNYVIGITDDVTNTSLSFDEFELKSDDITTLPPSTTQCMFWGMGGDGTVGANKQSIKDIADNTDLYVQAHFAYTAHKSGGVTISHLRFGPNEIKAEYEIRAADYISVHNPEWIKKFDQIVQKAKFNATLVLNSTWNTVEDIEANIPPLIRKLIAIKNIKLYNIDAGAVAKEVGLGKRINLIMQSVFYKLSGILPEKESLDIMINSIKKVYHAKGPKVIDMNIAAVNRGLDGLKHIEISNTKQNEWAALVTSDSVEHKLRDFSDSTPEFVRKVLYAMGDMKANDLPVSAFKEGGIVPQATSKYERRAISTIIPAWDGDKCTQCNYCSLVCPHAVIRPFLLNKEETKSAPNGYLYKKTKPAIAGQNYSIQIAPMDCTGCEVCCQQCPDDALTMVNYADNVDLALSHWEYSVNDVTNKAELGLVAAGDERLSVRGSQFYTPLCEFHGACAGCGESPYLKVITQMFGKNVVIANATGCSSIWGGSAPNNPYSVPWANSLFEDNAEFGYGIAEASNERRNKLLYRLNSLISSHQIENNNVKEAVVGWTDTFNDIYYNNIASDRLINVLKDEDIDYHSILGTDRNMLKKSSNWIVGGDGWAYDIGFGGLDHVFAQSSNVNILVLDTEMYSNTGGQASKSTPTAASVKFAEGGMVSHKKDLGQIAMLYQNIYVASVAMGADYEQCVAAFREAESYSGTSVIIALSPCIDWGFDMKDMMKNQKLAVDTGYWPLYRYDPRNIDRNKNPFQLDSKRIREDLEKYLKIQNRFGKLERAKPKTAEKLQSKLREFGKKRHEQFVRNSLDDGDYFLYLQQKLGHSANMETAGAPTLVLYGSETGNARNVADILTFELKRRNVTNIKLLSMDDYDFADLLEISNELETIESDESDAAINVIFAISTCGQGELPTNCQYFMKELLAQKLRGNKLCKRVNYGVFGLGDSSYVYFNEAAKILDSALYDMGANRIIDTGLGDDIHEDKYDTVFEEWTPTLFNNLNCDEASQELQESLYTVNFKHDSEECDKYIPNHGGDVVKSVIKTNRRLTDKSYDRDFRHYEFDITRNRDSLAFDVGDCFGVSPINDMEQVSILCDLYNLRPSNIINISSEDGSYDITASDLFSKKLDILGKPKRRFYELLSLFATNETEEKYLYNLINDKSMSDEYKLLRNGDTSSYIDLLLKFSSCRPTLNYLIEYIPEIKQRLYSIANSPAMYPNQIDLFVVKDDWYTKTDNIYKEGVCTKYLENLDPKSFGDEDGESNSVYCKIHGASVTIPETHESPLILTGLGSGLAPLRAHIQDRVFAASNGENIGEMALIFGSRNRSNEYFYQSELEEYHSGGKGPLTYLFPAFSRDQDKKYYVQNRIEEESKMIYDLLINKKGYFYYCGAGGNVPIDVKNAVTNSIVKHGNLKKEDAEKVIVDLQLSGHYNVEAW